LAHLIGDFLLQPDSWVSDKKKNKIQSRFLYFHTFIHFLLLLIFTGFKKDYFLGILIITFSHFAIDCAKLYIEKKRFSQIYFFADQFFHFLVIAAVVNYYFPFDLNYNWLLGNRNLLLATALISTTFVASVVLKVLLKNFNPIKKNKRTNNAGKYIGILERLFIFLFVAIDFWEGIGFLLAAKSIFRFGDLKENKDIRLTEYILIGTLLSFGIGILIGLAYLELLKFV
jgi:hypothetical protein